MLSAAVLALAIGPPEVVTVGRCRWERPAAVVATKPRTGSSVAVKKPARKRIASPTPPKPGDDFIGCDEDGPVWTSDIASVEFWPPEAPPERTSRLEPEPKPEPTPCECLADLTGGAGNGPWPVWGSPGSFFPSGPIPGAPIAPIPEPMTWTLILAGLALIIRKAA